MRPQRLPLFVLALVAALVACDQLNRPPEHPSNPGNGGTSGEPSLVPVEMDGGLAPAPSFTAQPGDLQL